MSILKKWTATVSFFEEKSYSRNAHCLASVSMLKEKSQVQISLAELILCVSVPLWQKELNNRFNGGASPFLSILNIQNQGFTDDLALWIGEC